MFCETQLYNAFNTKTKLNLPIPFKQKKQKNKTKQKEQHTVHRLCYSHQLQ